MGKERVLWLGAEDGGGKKDSALNRGQKHNQNHTLMKQCRYSLNNRKAFSTDKTLQQSMEERQRSQQGAETQSESHSDETM